MAESTDSGSFLRDVWTGVTKEVVIKLLEWVAGTLVIGWLVSLWKPARDWLVSDSHLMRWALVALIALLLAGLAVIWRLARAVRAERAARVAIVTAKLAPTARVHIPQQPKDHTFNPDKLVASPTMSTALLMLLERVGDQTTLDELYRLVCSALRGRGHTPMLIKGQIAEDMENAEAVGIVEIERPGKLTRYYHLTDDGRRWLLEKLRTKPPGST